MDTKLFKIDSRNLKKHENELKIAAEIIREKLLWLLDKEVPHGIAIEIMKMSEGDKMTSIQANMK